MKRLSDRDIGHLQILAAVAGGASVLAGAAAAGIPHSPEQAGYTGAEVLLSQMLWFALPLAVALFLVMLARGRDPELLKGHGSGKPVPGLPAAFLTNTMEQTVLAVMCLAAFLAVAPPALHGLAPAFAKLFVLGRVLFYVGYATRPLWRIFGLALGYYTSLMLLALAAAITFVR